jgi:hypothetical protein
LAGFEPATFGSSVKHTNYYTTDATKIRIPVLREATPSGLVGTYRGLEGTHCLHTASSALKMEAGFSSLESSHNVSEEARNVGLRIHGGNLSLSSHAGMIPTEMPAQQAYLHNKYGDIVKLTGLPGKKDMIIIFDPEDIEKVTVLSIAYRLLLMFKSSQTS